MTLIDPRPGMVRAFEVLNEEFGVQLDGQHFAANLGPPLPDVIRSYGFAEPEVQQLVDRFREIYPDVVIPATTPMPGADQPLRAVRDACGLGEPELQQLVVGFREISPAVGSPPSTPRPGAGQALRAVRDAGGRVLVVTGKDQPNAALHLEALGWEVGRLAGDVFASAKGT